MSTTLGTVIPAVVDLVLDRLDLTAIVTERVDLDLLVATVDLDAAADRLDLDTLTRRLNVQTVVDSVDVDALAARLDVDAVAARIDIEALLNRLDLTRIVRERIDVDAVVQAADLDRIIARIDLVGLTKDIIDAIDLPEIIRESTGSVASETVRDVRMRGVAGDESVARAVDRLLLRRQRRPAPPVRPSPGATTP